MGLKSKPMEIETNLYGFIFNYHSDSCELGLYCFLLIRMFSNLLLRTFSADAFVI